VPLPSTKIDEGQLLYFNRSLARRIGEQRVAQVTIEVLPYLRYMQQILGLYFSVTVKNKNLC
jgi:hypothetical protein